MLKEFKEFLARGNVVDLAVAVIIGAAFGKIITSLVEGVIMPPIGLVLGKVDFSSLFIVLDHAKGAPASLADAKTKGIPVIAYGAFFNDIVNFVIIAIVIFIMIKIVNGMRKKEEAATKDCPHCLSPIPLAATRCSGCCAELQAA
jgi:large conductance mechanosensitive channel